MIGRLITRTIGTKRRWFTGVASTRSTGATTSWVDNCSSSSSSPSSLSSSSSKRRLSTETNPVGVSTTYDLGFSTSSLGLEQSWIRPVQKDILQLPEIQSAWEQFPSPSPTIQSIDRAIDVFQSFNPGGREHLAVHALKAECYQRAGQYDDAVSTIEELSTIIDGKNNESSTTATTTTQNLPPNYQEDLILAKAKACWFGGRFDESLQLCDSIITTYNDLEETFPTTNLHMASAMTGKALSQLANMQSLDDAYSVRDFFRVTIQFLQRHPPSSTSSSSSSAAVVMAAVHSNAGIAEVVYNMFIEETNSVSMPITSALKTWFQGVQKLQTSSSSSGPMIEQQQIMAASKLLEATIQANLAWGVLKYEDDRDDYLSKASEYAKKALSVYDPTPTTSSSNDDDNDAVNTVNLLLLQNEGLPRVLSVIAECYREAESAVTAEGLYQSACDNKGVMYPSTLTKLHLRDATRGYADLCANWEKRDADSNRLNQRADEIDANLPSNWSGKIGLIGSTWFWTPGEMI